MGLVPLEAIDVKTLELLLSYSAWCLRRFTLLVLTLLTGCGAAFQSEYQAHDESAGAANADTTGTLGACPTPVVPGARPSPTALAPSTETYFDAVASMINAKCAYCHSKAAALPQSPDLSTYAGLKGNAAKVMEEIKTGAMPPKAAIPQWVASDQSVLAAWISAGYPLGTPPTPIDTSENIYYKTDIENLLRQQCTGCHSPGNRSPDLSQYQHAVNAATLANAAIQKGSMPPVGALSSISKVAFQIWLTNGTPYNSTGEPVPALSPDPEQPPADSQSRDAATSSDPPARGC